MGHIRSAALAKKDRAKTGSRPVTFENLEGRTMLSGVTFNIGYLSLERVPNSPLKMVVPLKIPPHSTSDQTKFIRAVNSVIQQSDTAIENHAAALSSFEKSSLPSASQKQLYRLQMESQNLSDIASVVSQVIKIAQDALVKQIGRLRI